MLKRNKKYYKRTDAAEKLALWQKELDSNLSTVYVHFKEILLYFISKSWLNNRGNPEKKYPSNISSIINGSNSIEPDEDFFVVNKSTYYAIKYRLKGNEKPLRKIGYFGNKKLVFIFDDLIYIFYKDKYNTDKIYEGYLSFSRGQNIDNIIHLLETYDINNFFSRTKTNKEAYKQILYFKGLTFELTLKHNIQNSTNYNNTKSNINVNNYVNKSNRNDNPHKIKSYSVSRKNNYKLSPNKKNKMDVINTDENEEKSSFDAKLYKDYSKKNIIDSERSSNDRSREQSASKNYQMRRNFLSQETLTNSPEHIPEDRKLSKNEEDKLDKIVKCLIYYYSFEKKFMSEIENSDGFSETSLCLINKEWLDFYLNKYNYYKIKEYLDKNYDNVEQRNFLEYKESLNNVCYIKDFILVKKRPIKNLEKEFTEYGQEYFENYELVNKHSYEAFKELFGSFEIESSKEYKINILKDRGLIINYNSTKIEITKRYMKTNDNNAEAEKENNKNENNNNVNGNGNKAQNANNKANKKRPERYLIVLSNGKYMNYKIKRPFEDKGIDEGMKNIGIVKNEEDINEESFQIQLKSEIIGYITNITFPPNKTLGNFVPTKPCLIGLEQDTTISGMNSVLQCLSNIPKLTSHLLNKKRIQQIYIQREAKPLSYEYVEVLKNLWLNEDIKLYSPKNFTNFIHEMNPFLSGKDSDVRELLFFLINNMHQELNKIENPSQYIPNDLIKFNYQLTFEMYNNYYNANYKSIISELFYGIKNDTLTCQNCRGTSHSMNCSDIIISPLDRIREYKGYSYDTVLIEECFDYEERKILLYNSQNYFCNFCHQYSNGVLCSKFIYIPKVLVIVLNRQEEKDFGINVVYNEILNLRKFIFYDTNPCKYELIGVINLLSNFGEEKKYVAFCKSSADKKWYSYDDSDVAEINFEDVKERGTTNVLIYNCLDDNK